MFILVNIADERESTACIDRISVPTHAPEARAPWLLGLACFRSGEEASVLEVTSLSPSFSRCSR